LFVEITLLKPNEDDGFQKNTPLFAEGCSQPPDIISIRVENQSGRIFNV